LYTGNLDTRMHMLHIGRKLRIMIPQSFLCVSYGLHFLFLLLTACHMMCVLKN